MVRANHCRFGCTGTERPSAAKNRKGYGLTKAAIKHSMGAENPSRLRTNARIGAIAGDVIANAIPVNALENKNQEAIGTYAMVSVLRSGNSRIVAVVAVEQHTNRVLSINADSISDQAHAFSGRIEKMKVSWRPKRPWLPRKPKQHQPQLPSISV